MARTFLSRYSAVLAVVLFSCSWLSGCSDDDSGGSTSDASVTDAHPTDAQLTDSEVALDAELDAVVPDPIHEPEAPWNACSAEDIPESAVLVEAHEQADHYWVGWEPGENARTVDATPTFPEGGPWRRVFLQVELECPEDGQCDYWDRSAAISILDDEGGQPQPQPIELTRYMTPYRLGMCYTVDVTQHASLLSGTKVIRSFIDTWVGPGHNQGHGWRVTTRFIFHPGEPQSPNAAAQVVSLWDNNAEDRLTNVGDPDAPLADELPQRSVTIPQDLARAELFLLLTGHGQGNLDNCAEFCTLQYTVHIDGQPVTISPWRNDCDQNPINTQSGTWEYNRAGWCPGAYVQPHIVDITDLVTPDAEVTFTYTLTDQEGNEYENTCRPDAGDQDNLCSGCAFDQSPGNCDYDWNLHTPPYIRVGAHLLIYR